MFKYEATFTRYALDPVPTFIGPSTGKSKNSMGRLNAAQERQFKKQRREEIDLSRSAWMKSTTLTEQEKRCLTRAWTRHEARVNKKFQNRHAYLKRRVVQMQERARRDDEHIRRLRRCVLGGGRRTAL